MKNFRNIQPKDNTKETKFKSICSIKSSFNLKLDEAKDMYYKILDASEVLYDPKIGYNPNLFNNINPYIILSVISENFISDEEYVPEHESHNYFTSRVPDEETEQALAWYETLSDEDKKRVDLVGAWNTPIAYACS